MILSMLRHIKERPHHHAFDYLFNNLDNDSERFFAVAEGYDNFQGRPSLYNVLRACVSATKKYWQNSIDIRFYQYFHSPKSTFGDLCCTGQYGAHMRAQCDVW